MNALRTDNLTIHLGGRAVVDAVSVDVAEGEWLTVIGPNGAGKSTMLRAIAGLLPLSDGTIVLHGESLLSLPRRERARRVAMVAQDPVVPPGMSVLDYVLLGRTPYIPSLGRESAADLDVVREVCDRLDLRDFTGRALETLSGGERQRVFLARALAQLSGAERGLLLLDEPTAALDIGHQQEVLELVDTLRADTGLTVVSTMHELSVAGQYADRLLLLSDGAVAASGAPATVLTTEILTQHYRARVRVVDTDGMPVVVPLRAASIGDKDIDNSR